MIYIKHFLVSTLKTIEEAPNPPLEDITLKTQTLALPVTLSRLRRSLSLPVLCEVSPMSLTVPDDSRYFFHHHGYIFLYLYVFQIQEPMIFQGS